MGADFSAEQKRWLEGFASGAAAVRASAPLPAKLASEASGPDAVQIKAQDRELAAGRKLADQEKWKRTEHPLDSYARLKAEALSGAKPKPEDNFRWRYHGLFHVAPAQDSYMCRLRIPNGILTHWQFVAAADIAERLGGGALDITTRANLQIREIAPKNAPALIERLTEVGLCTRGSGADNIRNVTGSATAGIDPDELLDTRPDARDWQHHILNCRAMFGLPRKFNVSFDGGGAIPTLEETNDIGFQAIRVREGAPHPAGPWYRLTLGGITGHKDFAHDTGVIVRPEEAITVADAIVRVFSDLGDRTNRAKARLKYVLDDLGSEAFLGKVEAMLGVPLRRLEAKHVVPRLPVDRLAHVGVHVQKQPGLNWIGVVAPAGRLSSAAARAVAEVARLCGDGDIRLTVWQNLLISGVPDGKIAEAKAMIEATGLSWSPGPVRAGLVACTGARGCRFANADTKGDALRIAEHVEARLTMDQPVNIHLTGCPNSCAQHYIGDIGLIGVKVPVGEDDMVQGYAIHVGGGFADAAAIGRLVFPDVVATEAPHRVEGLIRAYLEHRSAPDETFSAFAARHDAAALRALAETGVA